MDGNRVGDWPRNDSSDTSGFLFVDESRREGSGWQVSGLHSGTVPAVRLNSYAYCG